VLIDRSNLSQHMPWIVATVAVAVLASVWFFAASGVQGDWVSGRSFPGFTFGVLGGLICLFEAALWWRKKVRTWRIGRTQVWMRAHIWLGLLAVPLLVYHSGFRWGGPLSTVLMALFLVVIASGVWGLVVQQFLPNRMFAEVPAETIYSQIDHVTGLLAHEGEQLVLATCGPEEAPVNGAPAAQLEPATVGAGHLVVGAVRSAGRVQGKVLETLAPANPVPNSEFLRVFFRNSVKPYLEGGAKTGSPLALAPRAIVIFQDARARLNPAAHEAVSALENLCEQRRQLDLQRRIHFWLHNWLWVHLPLSVALILLMFVHVFKALQY
jgi:hypothetical protein